MLLRLSKLQRKTIGIYAPILLHDLGRRSGGGSQKQGIDASRAVPAQEIARYILIPNVFLQGET
jgi:hypothetical protein